MATYNDLEVIIELPLDDGAAEYTCHFDFDYVVGHPWVEDDEIKISEVRVLVGNGLNATLPESEYDSVYEQLFEAANLFIFDRDAA